MLQAPSTSNAPSDAELAATLGRKLWPIESTSRTQSRVCFAIWAYIAGVSWICESSCQTKKFIFAFGALRYASMESFTTVSLLPLDSYFQKPSMASSVRPLVSGTHLKIIAKPATQMRV